MWILNAGKDEINRGMCCAKWEAKRCTRGGVAVVGNVAVTADEGCKLVAKNEKDDVEASDGIYGGVGRVWNLNWGAGGVQ